jgi:hypothetical protein
MIFYERANLQNSDRQYGYIFYENHVNSCQLKYNILQKPFCPTIQKSYINNIAFKPLIASANFNEVKIISGMVIYDILAENSDLVNMAISQNIKKLYVARNDLVYIIDLSTMTLESTITMSTIKIAAKYHQYAILGEINHRFSLATLIFPVNYATTYTINGGTADLSNSDAITGFTINQYLPTNTIVKFLFSFDEKTTWKYWDGNSWETVLLTDINTHGMTKTDIDSLTGIALNMILPALTNKKLDVAISLNTSDNTKTPIVYGFSTNHLLKQKYQATRTTEIGFITSYFIGRWLSLAVDEIKPIGTSIVYEYSYSEDGGSNWTSYDLYASDDELRIIPTHGSNSSYEDQMKIRITLNSDDEDVTPVISELRLKYYNLDTTQVVSYPGTIIEGYDSTIVFQIPKCAMIEGTLAFRIAVSYNSDMTTPTYYDSWINGTNYNPDIKWYYTDSYDATNDPNDELLTNWSYCGNLDPQQEGIPGINGAPPSSDAQTYYLKVKLPDTYIGTFYVKIYSWNGLTDAYINKNFKYYDEFIYIQDYKNLGDGIKPYDWNLENSTLLTLLDSNITNYQKLTASITTTTNDLTIFNCPYFYKYTEIDNFDITVLFTNKNLYPTSYLTGLKIQDNTYSDNLISISSPDATCVVESYIDGILDMTNSVNGNYSYLRASRNGSTFTFYGKQGVNDSWVQVMIVERLDISDCKLGLFFNAPNDSTRNYLVEYLKEM